MNGVVDQNGSVVPNLDRVVSVREPDARRPRGGLPKELVERFGVDDVVQRLEFDGIGVEFICEGIDDGEADGIVVVVEGRFGHFVR